MAENNNDFGAFLAGVIVGGVMGALAALLMAPQSGEEIRTMLREKGVEIKDRATVSAEEALKRAEEARKKAEAFAAKGDWQNATLWAQQWFQYQVKAADIGLRAKTYLEQHGAKVIKK